MEKKMQSKEALRSLEDDDLTRVSGGVGYSSIQCKRCGKTFADMEQYRKHVEEAHANGKRFSIHG